MFTPEDIKNTIDLSFGKRAWIYLLEGAKTHLKKVRKKKNAR